MTEDLDQIVDDILLCRIYQIARKRAGIFYKDIIDNIFRMFLERVELMVRERARVIKHNCVFAPAIDSFCDDQISFGNKGLMIAIGKYDIICRHLIPRSSDIESKCALSSFYKSIFDNYIHNDSDLPASDRLLLIVCMDKLFNPEIVPETLPCWYFDKEVRVKIIKNKKLKPGDKKIIEDVYSHVDGRTILNKGISADQKGILKKVLATIGYFKPAKFSSYAHKCIDRTIRNYCDPRRRQVDRCEKFPEPDRPVYVVMDREFVQSEISDNCPYLTQSLSSILEQSEGLNKEIVRSFMEKRSVTYEKVGRIFNISAKRIKKIIVTMNLRMQNHLRENKKIPAELIRYITLNRLRKSPDFTL